MSQIYVNPWQRIFFPLHMPLLIPKAPENHLQNFSSFLFTLLFSNKHNDCYIYNQIFLLSQFAKFEKMTWNNLDWVALWSFLQAFVPKDYISSSSFIELFLIQPFSRESALFWEFLPDPARSWE